MDARHPRVSGVSIRTPPPFCPMNPLLQAIGSSHQEFKYTVPRWPSNRMPYSDFPGPRLAVVPLSGVADNRGGFSTNIRKKWEGAPKRPVSSARRIAAAWRARWARSAMRAGRQRAQAALRTSIEGGLWKCANPMFSESSGFARGTHGQEGQQQGRGQDAQKEGR